MQDWSPYAIGGATRPDSFTSMTPDMQTGLWNMLQAADSELGGGLQVYSGYRSPELQGQLYENALSKYGSEQAARKWVAPPGRSKHNSGQAADLKFNGVRIDRLADDHPARMWLSENVARFGLAQPMSWEPWQVEVSGARGQPAPAPAPAPASEAPQRQNALSEPQGDARQVLNVLAQSSEPAPPRTVNALDARTFMNAVQPIPYRSIT